MNQVQLSKEEILKKISSLIIESDKKQTITNYLIKLNEELHEKLKNQIDEQIREWNKIHEEIGELFAKLEK